jgi:hypothetical protein
MHNIPAARSFSSTGVRNASESSTKLAGVTGVDWASREDRIEGRRETMENASRDWPAKGPDYDCKMVGYGTVNADLPIGLQEMVKCRFMLLRYKDALDCH